MPEGEKPFKESNEPPPDKVKKEDAPLSEEKPTLPVRSNGTGLSSADVRKAAEKKVVLLEQFHQLVRELRKALLQWNAAQEQLVHQREKLQQVLQKPLSEKIADLLLSIVSSRPDTKAQDAAQLSVNNAAELAQLRLKRLQQLLGTVRAKQKELEQAGDECDDEIKRFLEELRFIDSITIDP